MMKEEKHRRKVRSFTFVLKEVEMIMMTVAMPVRAALHRVLLRALILEEAAEAVALLDRASAAVPRILSSLAATVVTVNTLRAVVDTKRKGITPAKAL